MVDSISQAAELPTITSNGPICEGEDLILSSSAAGINFDWIGPLGGSQSTLQNNAALSTNTGSTTIAAGSEAYLAGMWSVLVTDSSGCMAESFPIDIIINDIPIAEAFNNGPICPNSSIQLQATENTDVTTRYEWRIIGDTTIVSTAQNPIFDNLLDTTLYELTVAANGCTASTDTTTVIVWEAPVVIPTLTYTLNSDCSSSDLQLFANEILGSCLLYTSPSPRDATLSRMPSSA